mgnify:CR=1 FL=1
MTRPAPRASLPCPSCHAPAGVSLVVKIVEDRWQTHESLACDRCSLTQEADGERLTDAAEEVVLAAYGTWALFVESRGACGPQVLRRVQKLLDLSPSEARSRTAAGTTAPLAVGSKLMVDALALRECGAEVALREVPKASALNTA